MTAVGNKQIKRAGNFMFLWTLSAFWYCAYGDSVSYPRALSAALKASASTLPRGGVLFPDYRVRLRLWSCGAIMEAEKLNRKKYPSFGECIYCGAKASDVELTDEHLVPFSLGGNVFIENGSCKACATETGKAERVISRNVFWDMRVHIGEQSRRKNERPKTFKFHASINEGQLMEYEAPVEDAPLFSPMPVFGIPGIYAGDQPSETFRHYKAHLFYWIPPNIKKLIGARDEDSIHIPTPSFKFDQHKFARAIAKIAYCHAVVKYGLHGFRRLVTPALILGRYPFVPYFVGSTVEDPPAPSDPGVKHAVTLHETTAGRFHLLSASVRLYSNSGTEKNGSPIYDVVYGAPLTKRNL